MSEYRLLAELAWHNNMRSATTKNCSVKRTIIRRPTVGCPVENPNRCNAEHQDYATSKVPASVDLEKSHLRDDRSAKLYGWHHWDSRV